MNWENMNDKCLMITKIRMVDKYFAILSTREMKREGLMYLGIKMNEFSRRHSHFAQSCLIDFANGMENIVYNFFSYSNRMP